MIVTLIPEGTTLNSELHIGRMASICYDSDKGEAASLRRAAKCKDSGHLATLRFAIATFNVAGISRVSSHQIVRMAHAGILQRSQRYVKETNVEYIDPPALAHCSYDEQLEWASIQDRAETLYLKLIDNKKMKKEDARYILPHGCATEMNLCLNFQGWRDFLKNRASKHAQWEVRKVAEDIQSHLHDLAPNLFDKVSA
jgi:thymidylate synthase (FAD)